MATPAGSGIITDALNAIVDSLLETQHFVAEYSDNLSLGFATLCWLWYLAKVGSRVEAPWGFALRLTTLAGLGALVEHFPDIAKSVRNMLTFYGQRGLGSSDMSVITDPSKIIDVGFAMTEPLTKNAVLNAFDIAGMIWVLLCWLVMIAGFGWMTCRAFYVTTRWYAELIVATAMMPFVLLGPVRWLAYDGIKGVASSSIEMMMMCIMISIVKPALEKGQKYDIDTLHGMCVMAVLIGGLCWVVVGIPQAMGKRVAGGIGEGLIGGLISRAIK